MTFCNLSLQSDSVSSTDLLHPPQCLNQIPPSPVGSPFPSFSLEFFFFLYSSSCHRGNSFSSSQVSSSKQQEHVHLSPPILKNVFIVYGYLLEFGCFSECEDSNGGSPSACIGFICISGARVLILRICSYILFHARLKTTAKVGAVH